MTTKDRIYAFGYYGGKLSHLSRLLPLLPTSGVQTYVEPFAGSAAVLLNRPPSPVEVYNDLDSDIVTFFRVLREQPDEIIAYILLTPWSRAEYELSCGDSEFLPDIERARRFFVRINQGRAGIPNGKPYSWSFVVGSNGRSASTISRWLGRIPLLEGVIDRLMSVQIECRPAVDIVRLYDSPETLFYVDPPYVHDTRNDRHNDSYMYEMTNQQHIELAEALRLAQGRVALSGYDCELYKELYGGWVITRWDVMAANTGYGVRYERQEVLWTNYDPADVHAVTDLPLFAARPRHAP